jgi:hypothetical protein
LFFERLFFNYIYKLYTIAPINPVEKGAGALYNTQAAGKAAWMKNTYPEGELL